MVRRGRIYECGCVSVCEREIEVRKSDGFSFVCILEEREIHRRQLCRGICSKRLCGSLGNRARMRESE